VHDKNPMHYMTGSNITRLWINTITNTKKGMTLGYPNIA
jgi:hypothetical protein